MIIVPHLLEVAIETIDGKIASKHAAIDTEGADHICNEGRDGILCPVVIDHREATDLDRDVRARG